MKEIEEGCRAVIVNSVAGNNGIEVIIGKLIGSNDYDDFGVNRTWGINKSIINTRGCFGKDIGEHQLKRIEDDGSEPSSWEQCVWKPCGVKEVVS